MINRRFNRIEINGRHQYISEFGGHHGTSEYKGLVKCKLLHTEKASIIVPDQILLGNKDLLHWYQPLTFLPSIINGETCYFFSDISGQQTIKIEFSKADFIHEFDDYSHLYKCTITGSQDLETYATGEACLEGDHEIFLKLYHHTSSSTIEKIRISKTFWGSEWNIQGTEKKLENVRYVYFTPLDKIVNDDDLQAIGMSADKKGIGLIRDNAQIQEVIFLKVYRESSDNRQNAISQYISAIHLAPQHVHWHKPSGNPWYFQIVCPFIHRVGILPGKTYRFEDERFAGDVADLKQFKYLVIGDANSNEGLKAPYDEENTNDIFKIECTGGVDFITFWMSNGNKDLFSDKDVELQRFVRS
ncbi:MAG: hypothetical protein SFY67_10255 [Candidatus Melainabacteria bacterium]|nr:hypothetical protein [Candidatus Melainabacteria bacterium]